MDTKIEDKDVVIIKKNYIITFLDWLRSKFKKDYNQITPIEYIKRKKRKITKVILPSLCFLSVVC